jgi:hypothetical protein
MTTPQNGEDSQGAVIVTTNDGLPTNTGALIPDPGTPGAYQWGIATGGTVSPLSLSYSFPGASATWANTPYYSDPTNEPATYAGLDPTEQAAVRNALSAWSAVANISFTEVTETASDVGQFRFAWTNATNGGSAAWAYSPSNYFASGSDVWLSAPIMGSSHGIAADWLRGGSSYATLLHEIGHALGLKHPFGTGVTLPVELDHNGFTVMAYNPAPHGMLVTVTGNSSSWSVAWSGVVPRTLMVGDIQAIQYLYGANASFHAGADTYSWQVGEKFLETIWDAGGTDTVDASNQTLACVINLAPGSYSSIGFRQTHDELYQDIPAFAAGSVAEHLADSELYSGQNNLGIAFNCWIENAVGGSGADLLTGNTIGNTLTGSGGNDVLDGGSGLDTAVFVLARANYTVTKVGSGWTVTATSGDEGTDSLTGIEKLQFSDTTLTLGMTARDFNGDGRSDILLRNSAGYLWQYQVNGTAVTGSAGVVNPGADWKLAGNGDYNGDGKSDILLRNSSTGMLWQYQLNGTTISGTGGIGNPGLDWKVVGSGDYNGDGKNDILMRSDSSGALWQYQMNGTAISSSGGIGNPGLDWKVVGSGDYNGDGKNDILIRSDSSGALWQYQMNGTAISGSGGIGNPGLDWKVVGSGDYNGDGKSDILIRSDSSGALWQYQMNGTAIIGNGGIGNPGLDWKVAGSGDYNGDGKSDILLRSDSSGVLWQYQLNGTAITGGGSVAGPGTDWSSVDPDVYVPPAVVASKVVNDYNGDGKSDLLLQSISTGTIWEYQLNGSTVTGSGGVAGPGVAWKVAGTGDYNGDGKSDILLRNDTTGVLWEYQLNGSTVTGSGGVAGPGTDWKVAGSGDYNGDGKSDILLRSDSSGALWQYQMNGTSISGGGSVGGPGVDWKVVGNGDYNGDGKSDILLRNDTTGMLWQYQLNGTTISGSGGVTNPGLDWKVVGNGDYNGDGKSDILLRNDTTGMLWQYQLNGTTISGSGGVANPGTGWNVVGNGDYNGDGKSDILIRNDTTGTFWEYQMNGTTVSGGGAVTSATAEWGVVG